MQDITVKRHAVQKLESKRTDSRGDFITFLANAVSKIAALIWHFEKQRQQSGRLLERSSDVF